MFLRPCQETCLSVATHLRVVVVAVLVQAAGRVVQQVATGAEMAVADTVGAAAADVVRTGAVIDVARTGRMGWRVRTFVAEVVVVPLRLLCKRRACAPHLLCQVLPSPSKETTPPSQLHLPLQL